MLRAIIYSFLSCIPQLALSQYQLDSIVVRKDCLEIVTLQLYDPHYLQLEVRKEQRQVGKPTLGLEKMWVQYDALNNEVLRIDSEWDTTKLQWIEKEKRERHYDGENRMSAYTEYRWNANRWEGTTKATRDYVGQEQVTTTDFVWKEEQWTPIDKVIAQFNAANDEIHRLSYRWDSLSNNWRYHEKSEYSYHRENLLSESQSFIWNGQHWQNNEKISYEYNMPDSTTLTDQWLYKGTADGWIDSQRTIISYYDSARRNEIFTWSDEEDGWLRETLSESYFDRHGRETDFLYKSAKYGVHFQRLTIFDEHGRITLSQEIGYDGNKHAFGTQSAFVFDEDGNTIQEQDKYLDVENGRWILAEERKYTFDKSIALRADDGTRLQDKGSIGSINIISNRHAVTEVQTYKFEDGKPVLKETVNLYYSVL